MKIKIGEDDVDLSKAFPLGIGDWVDFEKAGILDADGGFISGLANTCTLLTIIVNKLGVTEDQVRAIPFDQMTDIVQYCVGEMADEEGADVPDRPTQDGPPSSSTISPTNTDGPPNM